MLTSALENHPLLMSEDIIDLLLMMSEYIE